VRWMTWRAVSARPYSAEKTQRVDAVLQTMGLSGCADTKGGAW